MTFKAILLEDAQGSVSASVKTLDDASLPAGDVTVAIEYSTINYKDGLVIGGLGRLVRQYPHVPGIDFAGTVETSNVAAYAPGDKVVLNGWRVGEQRWGGLAQKARVNSEWLVRLPENLTSRDAMTIGTAGLTAMLAVMSLESHGVTPESGEVVVTGAAGGVGSIAVALLANLGFRVAAVTGRAETHDYLHSLGANTIIEREKLGAARGKPLDSERWAGAIDTVGSTTLANVLAQTRYRGSVAACGLAQGSDLPVTVMPFIIRGVNLLGIDSVMCPLQIRERAWRRLGRELRREQLTTLTSVVGLAQVPAVAARILQGQVRGRTVVDVNL
ncbi:MAG: oxidoreductase [Proteobacteria bacterium]|nr:oxidoreductase [Pseudomonadota bacterium]